ncbi:MAG: hypothetical protein LQ345_004661 [Seirophora villosa]|nr:MAG: hypothetical protein LQ345_004661 [Seirophora villosa]
MAQVLSFPPQPDGSSHFGSTSLRHSSSRSSLLLSNPNFYSDSSTDRKSSYSHPGYDDRPSNSLPSSAPSSPRLSLPQFSNRPSYTSTPSSSLSLDEQCALDDEGIQFPSYSDNAVAVSSPASKSQPSPEDSSPQIEAPSDHILPPTTSHPTRAIKARSSGSAGDDMKLESVPTRHVDYLSHNWKEEDIWSSWRHIVARRKSYSNSTRLENASWRSWAKSKYRLKTVLPETLNWMKDHDVTWLYGPLQTGTSRLLNIDYTPSATGLSRSNSFGSKKPILKKRSLSEVMLQRSLSSSTLIQQATDALHAQQPGQRLRKRPVLGERALSDAGTSSNSPTPSTPSVEDGSSTQPSTSASGRQTPCTKRHIHFNDKVEQCIAINDGDCGRRKYGKVICDDSDSEDDVLMMKAVANQARPRKPSTPRNSFSNESKTIAMLPSTTLKYRGDTPDPAKQQEKQKDGIWSKGFKIPQSPSQETITPSSPSSNFLIDDEEELDPSWQPCVGRKDSIALHRANSGDSNAADEDFEIRNGLRRTPSGMFMPYDEDDEHNTTGLLGKVIDTVNTAKDIAHVIWNVGWRG